MPSAPTDDGLLTARPVLRSDVVILRTHDGAFLRHEGAAMVLKGAAVYRWLTAIAPGLDGGRTVADICAGLGPEHRDTLVGLIRALASRGFVKDRVAEPADPLEPAVARRFASQIEFVDHFADQPRRRFHAFRSARLVVAGSGEALRAAALGLLRNGAGTVHVAATDDPGPHRSELRPEADALAADGVPASLHIGPGITDFSGYDAVIHCGDDGSRLLALTRSGHERGPLLLPVLFAGGRAVLGPVTRPGSRPCWLCGQLRLAAAGGAAADAARWRDLAIGPLSAPALRVPSTVARMIGNAASFEIFRLLTGVAGTDAEGAVVVHDLETGESVRERVVPHPLCPVCAAAPAAVTAPAPARTREERLRVGDALVGPLAGVLGRYADDSLDQLPLKVARVESGSPPTRAVSAFGIEDFVEARLNVHVLAVREYAARTYARADAVTASADELTGRGDPHLAPTDLMTWTGLPFDRSRPIAWLPARSLHDGTACLVPAAAVYPFTAANSDGNVERTPAGAAAGFDRDEAIAAALASAHGYRALTDVVRGDGAMVEVPGSSLDDDRLRFLLVSAGRFGRAVGVWDLPGAAPGHAVLATVASDSDDRPLWTVGVGASHHDAVSAALRDLAGTIQLLETDAAGGVPDTGDPLLPDFDPRAGRRVGAGGPVAPPASTWRELLGDPSLGAYHVDTTPSDIRSTGALVSGTVLLRRRLPT